MSVRSSSTKTCDAEYAQMAAHGWSAYSKLKRQVADAAWLYTQKFDDPVSGRLGERC
jgi:hypothetical protein